MNNPNRVKIGFGNTERWVTPEVAAEHRQRQAATRAGWSLVISIAAVMFAWYSGDSASSSSRAAQATVGLNALQQCSSYRTLVLSLYDRGLKPDQIAAVLNSEQVSKDANGNDINPPGPAYDRFFRPTCGEGGSEHRLQLGQTCESRRQWSAAASADDRYRATDSAAPINGPRTTGAKRATAEPRRPLRTFRRLVGAIPVSVEVRGQLLP